MIKAIVADVDGVMVGATKGVNFPLPHLDVIQALKEINQSGVPIILCSAKFHSAIDEIIIQANLTNPHITDGGALIIDPLQNKIVSKEVIDRTAAVQVVTESLQTGIYTECYTGDSYCIDKSQVSDFTQKKTNIIQSEPIIVDDLVAFTRENDVIKINVHCINEEQITKPWDEFLRTVENINYIWTLHPSIPQHRGTTITRVGVSKINASESVLSGLGISFDQTLGIGDTLSDWNFMEKCKYAAAIGKDDYALGENVIGKGENGFISSSVEDNGLIEVFRYFKLM